MAKCGIIPGMLEFYRLLGEYGFSVIDYAEEDKDYEARTSREIAKRADPVGRLG
jgi:hypothetical protein